ncbi:hypothetical protein B566_EDAN014674 [Ephemera danica]|nr:hypothetical protein B566_EDAN014674 [Ephemera danica]
METMGRFELMRLLSFRGMETIFNSRVLAERGLLYSNSIFQCFFCDESFPRGEREAYAHTLSREHREAHGDNVSIFNHPYIGMFPVTMSPTGTVQISIGPARQGGNRGETRERRGELREGHDGGAGGAVEGREPVGGAAGQGGSRREARERRDQAGSAEGRDGGAGGAVEGREPVGDGVQPMRPRCCVCLDRAVNTLILQCGHLVMCRPCIGNLSSEPKTGCASHPPH